MLGYLLLGLFAHGSAENATVYQLTDLDLWCIDKLGISTTTTSTPWFVTSASVALAKERDEFRANVKRDGWLMAEEFQTWLEVRVYATFLCLTFGTPLLVMLLYRFSSTFRKWVTVIDRNLTFGRCFMLLVAVFVIAAGLCWFFSLRIVYTARLVMQDLQDYFLSSFSTRLMDIAISEFDNFTSDIIGFMDERGLSKLPVTLGEDDDGSWEAVRDKDFSLGATSGVIAAGAWAARSPATEEIDKDVADLLEGEGEKVDDVIAEQKMILAALAEGDKDTPLVCDS
eukprot:s371_g15.t1